MIIYIMHIFVFEFPHIPAGPLDFSMDTLQGRPYIFQPVLGVNYSLISLEYFSRTTNITLRSLRIIKEALFRTSMAGN